MSFYLLEHPYLGPSRAEPQRNQKNRHQHRVLEENFRVTSGYDLCTVKLLHTNCVPFYIVQLAVTSDNPSIPTLNDSFITATCFDVHTLVFFLLHHRPLLVKIYKRLFVFANFNNNSQLLSKSCLIFRKPHLKYSELYRVFVW